MSRTKLLKMNNYYKDTVKFLSFKKSHNFILIQIIFVRSLIGIELLKNAFFIPFHFYWFIKFFSNKVVSVFLFKLTKSVKYFKICYNIESVFLCFYSINFYPSLNVSITDICFGQKKSKSHTS